MKTKTRSNYLIKMRDDLHNTIKDMKNDKNFISKVPFMPF